MKLPLWPWQWWEDSEALPRCFNQQALLWACSLRGWAWASGYWPSSPPGSHLHQQHHQKKGGIRGKRASTWVAGSTWGSEIKNKKVCLFPSINQDFSESRPMIVNRCVTRMFKTCTTWLLSRGHWPPFLWIVKLKKDYRQHNNNNHLVWRTQNQTYFFFFCLIGKNIFFRCATER